jgi:hypothetical protein
MKMNKKIIFLKFKEDNKTKIEEMQFKNKKCYQMKISN